MNECQQSYAATFGRLARDTYFTLHSAMVREGLRQMKLDPDAGPLHAEKADWTPQQWIDFLQNKRPEFFMMFGLSPERMSPDCRTLAETLTAYAGLFQALPDSKDALRQTGAYLDHCLGCFAAQNGDPVLRCSACQNNALGKPMKRCGRCKMAHYCSSKCQKQHWKEVHKQQCRAPCPSQLDALVRARFKVLRRYGKDATTAMAQARQEYGLEDQNDVNAGQQVAAMFGMF